MRSYLLRVSGRCALVVFLGIVRSVFASPVVTPHISHPGALPPIVVPSAFTMGATVLTAAPVVAITPLSGIAPAAVTPADVAAPARRLSHGPALESAVLSHAREQGFATRAVEALKEEITRAPERAESLRPPTKRTGLDAHARTFGIELEMVGVTRGVLAQAIQEIVGGTIEALIDPADQTVTYLITAEDGRVWKVEDDYTLGGPKGDRMNTPLDTKAAEPLRAEIVSPILYRDEIPLVKRIVAAAASGGARANEHSGIHVHVGAQGARVEHVNALIDILREAEPAIIADFFKTNMDRITRFAKFFRKAFLRDFDAARPASWEDFWDLWYGKGYKTTRKLNRFDRSRTRGSNMHSIAYRGTTEFRYFDGTLDPDRVEQYIRFAIGAVDLAGFPDAPESRSLRLR